MATIYLSSTYEDLKDHRRVVYEALRKAGHHVIAMEDYVAADQRPVDKCLKDVEAADIYIGLFAFCYGYIPPVQHDNPKGLSITELEYRRAEALKKPCLTFVVQDTTPWSRLLDDAHTAADRGERIKALRQQLLTEKLASQFAAPHELSTLVLAAVTRFLDEQRQPESAKKQESRETAITWEIEKLGSPYPGLMHFTQKHAPVFFGREAEICDVLDRLRLPEGRFLIISGASGTGKSSLVDSGILPRLETTVADKGPVSHSVRMVPSRGRHFFDALTRPLYGYMEQAGKDAYAVSEQLLNHPDGLPQIIRDLVAKCLKDDELVLFLDQMEELFINQNQSQAHGFLSVLHRATQEAPLRVIATIRSDFLHHCHEHPDLLRILNGQGHIAVGPINVGHIADMILKPIQCAGLTIAPKLVRRLTTEAGFEPGSLPLLAFVLWQLFENRVGKELTEQAYDDMGGLAGAVGRQADLVIAGLNEQARSSFDTVFAELVHVERDRPPTRKRARFGTFKPDTAASQLIDALAGPSCRILVKGGEGGETTVEVAHEKLFVAWPRLNGWIDKSEEDLRLIDYVEEAARRWFETGCHLEELWRRERAEAVKNALKRFNKRPSGKLLTLLEPQPMLIKRLDTASLPHEDRLLIGQKLCEFGDTRPGVGVKDCLPDIVWVNIPGGNVKLEEAEHVFQVSPFRIAKYLVTNVQFEAFLNAEDGYENEEWWRGLPRSDQGDQPRWQEANAPREMVSWFEAVAFCRWFSVKSGTSIRLPTEWEWQQAATGEDPQREYPWESGWDSSRCNSYESRMGRTTAVGMYPHGASQHGLMDMAGNVREWCQNKYANPERPEAVSVDNHRGVQRVLRGGSWLNLPVLLRTSSRVRDYAGGRNDSLGFRLVQDIP